MKNIEAQIQSSKLNDVKAALAEIGIEGATVADATGHAGRTRAGMYRGRELSGETANTVRLELVVADERADGGVAAIVKAAGSVRMTITDLEEPGCHPERTGIYRGREYAVEFADKDKVELTVAEVPAGEPMVSFVMEANGVRMTVGSAAGFEQPKPHAGIYRGIAW